MALDMSNKAVTMMIKAVVGSLGINGDALIANITGFQHFVMECIGKHDARLVSIEQAILSQSSDIRELISLLKDDKENGLESEFAPNERAGNSARIEFSGTNGIHASPFSGSGDDSNGH